MAVRVKRRRSSFRSDSVLDSINGARSILNLFGASWIGRPATYGFSLPLDAWVLSRSFACCAPNTSPLTKTSIIRARQRGGISFQNGDGLMSAFLAFIASFWSRLATGALWAGTFAFLGPLGPVHKRIAQLIGGIITAAVEIVVSLSKSRKGELPFVYSQPGWAFSISVPLHRRGQSRRKAKTAALHKPCPSNWGSRHRR